MYLASCKDGPLLLDMLHEADEGGEALDDSDDLQDIPDFLPALPPPPLTRGPIQSRVSGCGHSSAKVSSLSVCGGFASQPLLQQADEGNEAMESFSGYEDKDIPMLDRTLSERQEADANWLSVGRMVDSAQAAIWDRFGFGGAGSTKDSTLGQRQGTYKGIGTSAIKSDDPRRWDSISVT
eukprot:scaffold142054_cov51-Prasinocladus_malaysianus.AAC.5